VDKTKEWGQFLNAGGKFKSRRYAGQSFIENYEPVAAAAGFYPAIREA
jgi:hypothetical protein